MDSNIPTSPPSSAVPPGMPPGMYPETQAEFDKANWALGLGIASFLCGCLSAIPALIIGWPAMKRAQNPVARGRAKIGVILSFVALGMQVLMAIFYFTFIAVMLNKVPLDRMDRELQKIERDLRVPSDSRFLDDDDKDDKD
ncbi:MAG: DUF4190 domain-containing protein [Cystobacterineae bacterium]|nr:DUF4190 domain-containing protein [Cystobacterineae bacterium]